MSEAARSRRDAIRYEPQVAVPDRDPAARQQAAGGGGSSDPLAELARLVGQNDPYRNVFRPTPARPEPARPDGDARFVQDSPHVENGHDHDAYGEGDAADGDPVHHGSHDPYAGHDPHAGYERQGHDDGGHPAEDDPYLAQDDRYYAAEQAAHPDEAGMADEHLASALPDVWARGEDGFEAGAHEIDDGSAAVRLGSNGTSSARRPVAVLAAVLLLTGGGLAATFLARGAAVPGAASAGGSRGAPTIMAAAGPTKVKVDDGSTTAPEDQDAALLNKTGAASSGPVKIVSSEEQPADLSQLPKSSDLAAGASPLPQPSASPFPEPKKVKTFLVHPDGTMLSANGTPASEPVPPSGAPNLTTSSVPAPAADAAPLPATPRTAARGGTTPKSVTPADNTIATLSADPALSEAAPAPASPGVTAVSTKPDDAAASATAGGYGLQLAASPSEAAANAAFAKLKKKYPAQLGSYTASVHKSETGGKPVYRLRVGGMSQDEAKALCSKLQTAGGSCFVVHN